MVTASGGIKGREGVLDVGATKPLHSEAHTEELFLSFDRMEGRHIKGRIADALLGELLNGWGGKSQGAEICCVACESSRGQTRARSKEDQRVAATKLRACGKRRPTKIGGKVGRDWVGPKDGVG